VARAILSDFAAIRLQGDTAALRNHQARVSSEQNTFLLKLEQIFRQAGYQPPLPADVFRSLGTDPGKSRSLLESLIKANRLVRITDNLIFHADVVRHVRQSLSAHKGRRFSVPEFKEWTQISRKYAIPLLEYLDRQRVTKRDGDARVVL
jgi:selenocysteine-specific elongation factor